MGLLFFTGCTWTESWIRVNSSSSTDSNLNPAPVIYKTVNFSADRSVFRLYTDMSNSSAPTSLTATLTSMTEIDPLFVLGKKWEGRSEPLFSEGNVWNSIKSNISKNRSGSQYVQIQGKYYKYGGLDEGGFWKSDIYSFDLNQKNFKTEFLDIDGVADLDFPKPRQKPGIATVNGKIYLFGGLDTSGLLRNDIWEFDPSERKYSLIKSDNNSGVGIVGVDFPESREAAEIIGYGSNELYLVGGRMDPGITYANDVWTFNLDTATWTLKKDFNNAGVGVANIDFPFAVVSNSCIITNGAIFCYGGYSGNSTDRMSGSASSRNTVWRYDLATHSWLLDKASNNGGIGVVNIDFPSASHDHQLTFENNLIYIYLSSSSSEIWTYDVNTKIFEKVLAANNNGVGSAGVDYPAPGGTTGGTTYWQEKLYLWRAGASGNTIDNTIWEFSLTSKVFQIVHAAELDSLATDISGNILSIENNEVYMSMAQNGEQGRLIKYNLLSGSNQLIHRGGSTFEPGTPSVNYPNFNGSAHCMMGNKVYYFGGYLVINPPPYLHYNQVWEYDISQNSYQLIFTQNNSGVGAVGVDFPRGRAALEIACVNGKIYVVGGQSSGSYNNDVWSFDVVSLQWTRLKGQNNDGIGSVGVAYPTTQRHGRLLYFEGNLFYTGGQKTNSVQTNELWKFDLTNNSWERQMAENNGGAGVANVNYPVATSGGLRITGFSGNLYAVAQSSISASRFNLWKFDLVSKTWVILRDVLNNGIGDVAIDYPLAGPQFYTDPVTQKIFGTSAANGNHGFWELDLNGTVSDFKRRLLVEITLPSDIKSHATIKMNYFGKGDNSGTLAAGASVYFWKKSTGSFSLISENSLPMLSPQPSLLEFDINEKDEDNKIYLLISSKFGNGPVNKSTLDFDPSLFEIKYQD